MVIIFAILLFCLLIVVHEFGHFIAAKLCGVQVNEFSIFMGPALVQWGKGETKYSIRCIPLGGYCAMEGEDEETDNPRAFTRAKWWKRLIILVAGSAMNFVIGLLLVFIVLFPAQRFVTPDVVELDVGSSLSEGNAILPGDRILSIAGERVYVQSDFSLILTVKGSGNHDVTVLRNGEKVVLEDVLFEARTFGEEKSPRYGITFDTAEATFGERLKYTWYSAVDYVRMVRMSLTMLLTGQAGIQDMAGPVGIVDQMAQTTQTAANMSEAMFRLLDFGALIAINLAVMNLLPIPALDGGRVLLLLITTAVQAVTKKKLDPKYEGYIHAAGLVLLLGFMASVTLTDIFGLFN